MRDDFGDYRTKTGRPDLSELECFIGILRQRLSPAALEVVNQAQARNRRYESLSAKLMESKVLQRQISRLGRGVRIARVEATTLKIIVEFEPASNRNERWRFSREGTAQLRDDFMLFHEYLGHHGTGYLNTLCRIELDLMFGCSHVLYRYAEPTTLPAPTTSESMPELALCASGEGCWIRVRPRAPRWH